LVKKRNAKVKRLSDDLGVPGGYRRGQPVPRRGQVSGLRSEERIMEEEGGGGKGEMNVAPCQPLLQPRSLRRDVV